VKCEKLIEKDMMIDANAAITLLEKRPEKKFQALRNRGKFKAPNSISSKGIKLLQILLNFLTVLLK